jgi:ubiquinone/menaquinone biosynthesis C-methylase UbiE
MTAHKPYVPAAGQDWLLPLYDPLVWLLGANAVRQALLDHATLRARDRVLDIGCGTGTMVVHVKRRHPDVEVVGLDPDPKALARARRKAERAQVAARFDQGYSDELPYAAEAFEHVFSSFMFHHLPAEAKQKTLHEVLRVLVPGGFLHLLDFAPPAARSDGFFSRLHHGTTHGEETVEGRIPALLRQTGFENSREIGTRPTRLRPFGYYQASAPLHVPRPVGS